MIASRRRPSASAEGRPRCAAGSEGALRRAQSRWKPSDELELKYAVSDLAAVEAFLDEHFPPATDVSRWRSYKTTDRVFDSADGALQKAGYGARLRRSGGQVTLGLKSDVAVADGIHHRRELEAEAADSLRAAGWPASEPAKIVRRVAGDRRLVERFVLRQSRRERAWQSPDGGERLFSLDRVVVASRGKRLAELQQLEVELRAGGRELLRKIDATIMASGLVTHEPRSKLAIAAELVEGTGPLRPDEPFAEAGRRVLRRHLERMLERERATRAGDTLALKQMRVATRRMRATWRLFDGAYRRRDQRRYLRELRRVADRLGAVRDLDVLLEALPDERGLEPLAAAWRDSRAKAWQKLLDYLDSGGYRTFTDDYREFSHTPGLAAAGSLARRRARDAAGSRIWAAYEHVAAHEPHLAGADVATLHALRIDGKRLRYALETFRDVLPQELVSDLITRLTRMQDHLGALNDADVAAARATAWLNEEGAGAGASAHQAVESYLAERRAEIERLRRGFPHVWRPIGGSRFRQSLGRAIAQLA